MPLPPPPPTNPLAGYLAPPPAAGTLASAVRHRSLLPAEQLEVRRSHVLSTVRGPIEWMIPILCGSVTLVPGLLLLVSLEAILRRRARARAQSGGDDLAPAPWPVVRESHEVRRVSLAFDWTARARLQADLDRLASTLDMSTPEGLARGLAGTRALLGTALGAVRYAAFASERTTASSVESRFQAVSDDLQGRYQVGVISNRQRVEGLQVEARTEEGQGLVVVSLVTATSITLPSLPPVADAASLAAALAAFAPAGPRELLALDVIWSPALETDRMSSAELEVVYPDMVKLAGASAFGRVRCAYCQAVFAAENGRCPQCGAVPT